MSSKLIGTLLDEALLFVRTTDPGSVVALFDTDSRDPNGQPWTARSAARSYLAKAIRRGLGASSDEASLAARDENPTYRELIGLGKAFSEVAAPDIIAPDRYERPLAAIEIGYGFEPDCARATVDRLLNFLWLARGRPAQFKSLDLIAYIFVHELRSGEDIRQTEQRINSWIDAHYGPFNGMDRIMLPMMPRLTRSGCISTGGPPRASAAELKGSPTGYVTFCISYQMDCP